VTTKYVACQRVETAVGHSRCVDLGTTFLLLEIQINPNDPHSDSFRLNDLQLLGLTFNSLLQKVSVIVAFSGLRLQAAIISVCPLSESLVVGT